MSNELAIAIAERIEELQKQLAAGKAREETHIMQLVAISTATIQNTETSKKERINRDNPYWTQAYADVCTAVDREIAQRERADKAETARTILERDLAHAFDMGDQANVCLRLTQVRADKAEAACAEMRAILSRWDHYMPPQEPYNWSETFSTEFLKRVKHALSYEDGRGWLSPEVKEKVREALELCDAASKAYGVLPSSAANAVEEALALLGGKEPK